MSARRLIVTAAMLASISTAHAEQATTTLRFKSELKDGKITVLPEQEAEAQDGSAVPGDFSNSRSMMELFKNQAIYVGKDSSGQLNSIFAVPKGTNIPADALFGSAPPGTEFSQVSSNYFLDHLLPSKEDVARSLVQMLESAQVTVCQMKFRPTTFGAAVDVAAGAGVTGRIEFNATWNTADLCK